VPTASQKAALLHCFAAQSERIQLMLAHVADLHVVKGEKILIFSQNPTKQEIINCLLNIAGLKSAAHMSRYAANVKASLINAFNYPTSTFSKSNSFSGRLELNFLVNSINSNTGSNMQEACCAMLLTGLTPTHPIFIQCIGRIVRIGQRFVCIIIELYNSNTHNKALALASTYRALP
jgi:superfamily II DNA or RNA helicase